MDILDLFKGAIISIESREGKRQIWVHIGKQRFPLVIRPSSGENRPKGSQIEASTHPHSRRKRARSPIAVRVKPITES